MRSLRLSRLTSFRRDTSAAATAPAAAAADGEELIDLTEAELEQALGGKSIDDELFGDDAVIDLTDESEQSKSFEFFSRD